MRIVAFLQNQWFKNPTRAEQTLAKYIAAGKTSQDFGRDMLFFSCITGRRLEEIFGEELCRDTIIWDNISPKFGSKSNDVFPPDYEHINKVLDTYKPDVILVFGKAAKQAFLKMDNLPYRVIFGPHPAARHPTVINELKQMKEEIEHVCMVQKMARKQTSH